MEYQSDKEKVTTEQTSWLVPFFQQIRQRWAVALLLGLSIFSVVVLHTYVRNSSDFQHRSMQLIMKDMGHNLWFLEESADLFEAIQGSPDLPAFSADRIQDLAGDREIASTYWGNVLQGKAEIRSENVLLTGIERVDDHQITEERPHLLDFLPQGQARLGYDLAEAWDMKEGDTLIFDNEGREYEVETVYPQRGNLDDARLWIPLDDAQDWLNKPGRSNLILGFLCMRGLPLDVGLERMHERVNNHHQGFKVVPLMNILEARALARVTTSSYLEYLLMTIVAMTAVLIAAIGWMEVNERRHELAIMLAMGARYHFLLLFFLGKLALLAVVASFAGFLVGSYLSVHWLSPYLLYETRPVSIVWADFPVIIFSTLALIAAAAVVPLMHILRLDPTRILAEE